jgi:hypothetical protein
MEKAEKVRTAIENIVGWNPVLQREYIATALREAEARGRASMKEDAAKEEGTVSDIPDEIMIAANECHLFTFNRGYRQSVEAIARALMAERKRALEDAAKVADRARDEYGKAMASPLLSVIDHDRADDDRRLAQRCCNTIATAIRASCAP